MKKNEKEENAKRVDEMLKNILVVDDSALMRRVISDIINSDSRFKVKDFATNGLEALDLIIKNRFLYDAVILDINMPKLNGLELLEHLKRNKINLKIIIVSAVAKEGAQETIIALERGAFDLVTKPDNFIEAKGDTFKTRLLKILCVATECDTSDTKHELLPVRTISKATTIQTGGPHKTYAGKKDKIRKLIAIACSTGGPKSLHELIPALPADLDAPVLLVQHMPRGFTNSLAQRLNEMSRITVKEAEDGDVLQKGCVYIAPGGKQMTILKSKSGQYMISTSDDPAVDGLRPNANLMYYSLEGSSYDEITCVVLTGMGSDGTKGIARLGQNNNIYVIAQDEATSVVYGMPKAVADAKLADEILPLSKIADAIIKNVGVLKDGC